MNEAQAFAAAMWSLEILDQWTREELITRDTRDHCIREIKTNCTADHKEN